MERRLLGNVVLRMVSGYDDSVQPYVVDRQPSCSWMNQLTLTVLGS